AGGCRRGADNPARPPRAGGPLARGRRLLERRGGREAGAQRAHGRAAPAQQLREARRPGTRRGSGALGRAAQGRATDCVVPRSERPSRLSGRRRADDGICAIAPMLAVGPVGDGCCMTRRSAPEIIIGLSAGHVAARALHEVAELGVADALDTEPRSTAELAMATGADADALHRLLRLLEAHGLFVSDGDGRWRHSESSRWLRSDHPRSLRAFARMMGLPVNWEAFAGLGRTVRTGEPGYASLDPPGLWAYLAANPDERVVFQEAMIAKAHDDVAAALAAHDFSAYRCLVDVGGGQGQLLRAVLAACPDTRGILFELPEVAATVAAGDRLDVVAGNFFTDPLPAADAYVLMNI